MEKLELKHIAPYLPYGLKAISVNTKEVRTVTLLHFTYDANTVGHNHLIYHGLLIDKHIPILRPLSNLKEEHLIDFYPFTSSDLELIDINEWIEELIHMIKGNDKFQLMQFNLLFEWHFDVFGLIDKGLAIDINTLNK